MKFLNLSFEKLNLALKFLNFNINIRFLDFHQNINYHTSLLIANLWLSASLTIAVKFHFLN